MVIIYNKLIGEINQVLWEDSLPDWFELSGNEGYEVVDTQQMDIDPHALHLCQLELDSKGKVKKIKKPSEEWLKERRKMR